MILMPTREAWSWEYVLDALYSRDSSSGQGTVVVE